MLYNQTQSSVSRNSDKLFVSENYYSLGGGGLFEEQVSILPRLE